MKDINIIRTKKTGNYVMLNKSFLNDQTLSLKAKGLLAYLLSLPDDWKIYIDELVKHHKEGKDAIKKTLNELIDKNYVCRDKVRSKGKFKGYSYKVFETPLKSNFEPKAEKPSTEKPLTDLSLTTFPQLLNNNNTNNNYTNNKQNNNPLKNGNENADSGFVVDVVLFSNNISKDDEIYTIAKNVLSNFESITRKKSSEKDVICVLELLKSTEAKHIKANRKEKIIISTMTELQSIDRTKKINSVNYFKVAILNKFKSEPPPFKLNNKLF